MWSDIWCELSLCIRKCRHLCTWWHFAGVFFISLCLSPCTLSVLCEACLNRLDRKAAVTIAGLFLGRCSLKWNAPSCLYWVLHRVHQGGKLVWFYRSPPAFSQCTSHGSLPMSGSSPVPTRCTVYFSCVVCRYLSLQSSSFMGDTPVKTFVEWNFDECLTKITLTKAGNKSMCSIVN